MDVSDKIIVHGSFKTLVDQLCIDLEAHGFILCGTLNPQLPHNDRALKYVVLLIDLPSISTQMRAQAPLEGTILPCCVSLIEVHAGEIAISLINPTEVVASASGGPLLYLAREVSSIAQRVIQKFSKDKMLTHDLITSWG